MQREILTVNTDNGNTIRYKLVHYRHDLPVAYHEQTDEFVIRVLEKVRLTGDRIIIKLGNTETGEGWNEEFEVQGYIGLSRGNEARFPILLYSRTSVSGGTILDHCILKIKSTRTNAVMYTNPKYKEPTVEIIPGDMPEYPFNTVVNGKLHGRHRTRQSAARTANILKP